MGTLKRAGHSNNCQMIIKLFGYDKFCKHFQHKKIKENLEVLINHVTNRGKARMMLHIGEGHSSNGEIILKLFGYDIPGRRFWQDPITGS